MGTFVIILICLLVLIFRERISRFCENLMAVLGLVILVAICILMVWGGAALLHWLFGMSYIAGGGVTLTSMAIYGFSH